MLKLGENLEQLNTISVPSGGQTKSTEPNDKASETRPEETQPDSSTGDGSDGQEDGNQGADGGEVSPSELSLVLTWNAKSIACAAGNTQAFSVSSYELNEDLFRFRVSLTGTQAQDAKIVNGISITESTQTARELKWPSDSLIMNPAAGTDKEVYNFSFTVRTAERMCFSGIRSPIRSSRMCSFPLHGGEPAITKARCFVCPAAALWIKSRVTSWPEAG